jgi:hypothetical protein
MARSFENPTNGHKEDVGIGASIGVFFFGALYLAVQGLCFIGKRQGKQASDI